MFHVFPDGGGVINTYERLDKARHKKYLLRVHTQPVRNQFDLTVHADRMDRGHPIFLFTTATTLQGHCTVKIKISKVEIKSMEHENSSPMRYRQSFTSTESTD